MTPPTNFCVTGASGFIGRHLVTALVAAHGPQAVTALVPVRPGDTEKAALDHFQQLGVEVFAWDLLRPPEAGRSPPPCDVLYHLAGYAVTEDPRGPFEVNSEGTRNLLDWLGPNFRGKRIIYTSTLASVDKADAHAAITESTPCAPVTPYGRTKLEGENIIRARATEYGGTFTILRLCTIIGPGFRPGGMFGVFPELLRRNALATRLNWPGRVSFLDVSDLVRLLLAMPTRPEARNEIYVTANGGQNTFDQVLEEIAATLRIKRRRMVLPPIFWKILGAFAWRAARVPALPYRARIFCWRVSHLVQDGLFADATRLNSLLGGPFRSTQDSLREIYGRPQ